MKIHPQKYKVATDKFSNKFWPIYEIYTKSKKISVKSSCFVAVSPICVSTYLQQLIYICSKCPQSMKNIEEHF